MNSTRLRYLPQWIDILSVHVSGWALARPLKARTAETLPPPFLLMALRGEGILRTRFCDWADDSPLDSSPDQLLRLWTALWEEGAEIQLLCERIGLSRLAGEQAAIPVPTWAVQRSLYACFLAGLANEQRHDLLLLATDKLFSLALARQFPAGAATPERITLTTLRQRAHTHIQKALALPIKLRERFATEENAAHFTLRVAVNKGEWQDLLDCRGTRLKPIKRQGYQAALQMEGAELRARLLKSPAAVG